MTNPMLAPSSAPVLLSPFYDGDHRMVHHAPLADGRTIVVWAGTGSAAEGYDIFAQFLDETGAPVGTPFVVNSYLISDQIMPQVTALPGGGFVVAWQSFAQDDFSITDPYDSQFTLQYGIYCQTFDAAGAPVGGETLVNENTVGHQFKPKMLTLDDGGYIVFWGELRVTYFQRFDADGNKVGTATMVPAIEEDGSSFLFGPWGESNFVQLDDGNIAVFWTKTTQTASHVTIFDLDGVLVNEFDVGVGSQTMMVQLENGNLFLAWTSQMDGIVGSGEATHMIGAVYTPAGEVVVPAFQISELSDPFRSHIPADAPLLLPNGNLLLIWVDLDGRVGEACIVSPTGEVLTDFVPISMPGVSATYQSVSINGNGDIQVTYSTHSHLFSGFYNQTYSQTFTLELDPITTFLDDGSSDLTLDGDHNHVDAMGGDDTITGGDWQDHIFGAAGHDLVFAGGGDDVVFGGLGNDDLAGGSGNDVLQDLHGEDTLSGNEGDDILWAVGDNATIYGGVGNDTINSGAESSFLFGGVGNDNIHSIATSGLIQIDGGAGDDYIYAAGRNVTAFGGDGDDFIYLKARGDAHGGAGNDTVLADEGNLSGGEGIDTVHISGTVYVDDQYYGTPLIQFSISGFEIYHFVNKGDGGDKSNGFYGGDIDEVVYLTWNGFYGDGGGGNDWFEATHFTTLNEDQFNFSRHSISGGDGDDTIIGGSSNNSFYGDAGNDVLHGGNYNDFLVGGTGNDILSGGAGINRMEGGDGADVFIFNDISSQNTIADFEVGVDVIDLSEIYALGNVFSLELATQALAQTACGPNAVFGSVSVACPHRVVRFDC